MSYVILSPRRRAPQRHQMIPQRFRPDMRLCDLPSIANVSVAQTAIACHNVLQILENGAIFAGAYVIALQKFLQQQHKQFLHNCGVRIKQFQQPWDRIPETLQDRVSGGLVLYDRHHVMKDVIVWMSSDVRKYLLCAWKQAHNMTLFIHTREMKTRISDDVTFKESLGRALPSSLYDAWVVPVMGFLLNSLHMHITIRKACNDAAAYDATWHCERKDTFHAAYPFPPIRISERPLAVRHALYQSFLQQNWTQDIELQPTESTKDTIHVNSTVLALYGGKLWDVIMTSKMKEPFTRKVTLPVSIRTIRAYCDFLFCGEASIMEALQPTKKQGMPQLKQPEPIDVMELFYLANYVDCKALCATCINALSVVLMQWKTTDVTDKHVADVLGNIDTILHRYRSLPMWISVNVAKLWAYAKAKWPLIENWPSVDK